MCQKESLSWVIWVAPKCNHSTLMKGGSKRDSKETHRDSKEEWQDKDTGKEWGTAQDSLQPPEAGRLKGQSLPSSLGRNMALLMI